MDNCGKEHFLDLLQGARIRVHVGRDDDDRQYFQISSNLLSDCSDIFYNMCGDIGQDVIELHDVKTSTFMSFFLWVHSWYPGKFSDIEMAEIVDLALFAEKYGVNVLLNQILDLLRKTWDPKECDHSRPYDDDEWYERAATPELISKIYENTKDDSPLRQLCAAFIDGVITNHNWSPVSVRNYEPLFRDFSQLGLELFKYETKKNGMDRSNIHEWDEWRKNDDNSEDNSENNSENDDENHDDNGWVETTGEEEN